MDKTALVKVHHKEYGDGEVIKITEGKIYVQFCEQRMIFPYPDALEKGYLSPKGQTSDFIGIDSQREITLDVVDNIGFKKIYEAINAIVGTNYSGWMKAGWPNGKEEYPFQLWFPKLAETKDGKLVSAAFDCVNTISDDWNEVIYEDLKDTPPEIDGNWKTSPILIFAKEPKGGPYIFRGVYVRDIQKSRYKHHVVTRIATRVKLIGKPSDRIEILDDIRA